MASPRTVCCALLVGALAIVGGCGSAAPPRLEVTSGRETRARTAAQVAARFTLRNAGGRDLLLHGLVADCGCRLATVLPDALASGEEATLTLVCRVPPAGGEQVRDNRLLSNDPARPQESLRVATAAARTSAEPAAIYFGYVKVGGSATRDLVVKAGGAPPVADDPAIGVEPLPPRPDGKRAYRVRFTPRAAGAFRTTIRLGRDLGAIAASGVGYRGILVFPPELALPNETTASGPPPIVLKNDGEVPLEIAGVEFPPGLAGELETLAAGREYRLALRAEGRRAGRGGGGAIRLHTDMPEEPLVVIPVRYARVPAAGAAPPRTVVLQRQTPDRSPDKPRARPQPRQP